MSLRRLVKVAGRRWRIEECIQAGKGLAGLDEHQVRRWTSWRRWTILSMLAHAFLAVIKILEERQQPSDSGLIPLTCNEIRHLFATLILNPVHDLLHRAYWSIWRRRHEYLAKISHYRRRGAEP